MLGKTMSFCAFFAHCNTVAALVCRYLCPWNTGGGEQHPQILQPKQQTARYGYKDYHYGATNSYLYGYNSGHHLDKFHYRGKLRDYQAKSSGYDRDRLRRTKARAIVADLVPLREDVVEPILELPALLPIFRWVKPENSKRPFAWNNAAPEAPRKVIFESDFYKENPTTITPQNTKFEETNLKLALNALQSDSYIGNPKLRQTTIGHFSALSDFNENPYTTILTTTTAPITRRISLQHDFYEENPTPRPATVALPVPSLILHQQFITDLVQHGQTDKEIGEVKPDGEIESRNSFMDIGSGTNSFSSPTKRNLSPAIFNFFLGSFPDGNISTVDTDDISNRKRIRLENIRPLLSDRYWTPLRRNPFKSK